MARTKRVRRTSSAHLVVLCLAGILVALIISGICALYSDHPASSRVWDIISHSTTAVISGLLAMIATSRR
jgi:hypothetical protein